MNQTSATTPHEPDGARQCLREAGLARSLNMSLTPCTRTGDHHNEHFRGRTPSGTLVFVKLLDDAGYWRRAVRAAAVAESVAGRTPRLLDHGEFGNDRWWLIYEWADLATFTPTTTNIERAGELLGELHHATREMHLADDFERYDLDRDIEERIAALDALDPTAAERVRSVRARWGVMDIPDEVCFMHGDVHWSNFGIDGTGEVVWYDWENAARGHPVVDFGKLVDLGLSGSADRDAFLRGYHRHAPTIYPWPPIMGLVRLWCTAGVLVYALARGMSRFADHGYEVLGRLECLS